MPERKTAPPLTGAIDHDVREAQAWKILVVKDGVSRRQRIARIPFHGGGDADAIDLPQRQRDAPGRFYARRGFEEKPVVMPGTVVGILDAVRPWHLRLCRAVLLR